MTAPQGPYHVRGYAKDREAITGYEPGPELFYLHGVEGDLFQFWPTEDNPGRRRAGRS